MSDWSTWPPPTDAVRCVVLVVVVFVVVVFAVDFVAVTLHEEARPASAVLDTAYAASRGATLRRLRQELRGDLDRILAKALEKQPSRRYATIDAFADDLGRHLRGEPVRAQRASLRYRARKFVQRHAFGLAVTIALSAAIVAGIAGTLWQARRAEESAQTARAEAAAAGAVRDLLLDMFRTADPDVARGRDPSASEMLDTAMRRLQAAARGLAETAALSPRQPRPGSDRPGTAD